MNKTRLHLLCPDPQNFSAKIKSFSKSYLDTTFETLGQDEFERYAPDYDVVMVRFNTKVDEAIFGKNSKIRAVLSPTTGLDHINLDAAKRNNIKLFHLRGQKRFLKTVSATAELTIGLLLSLVRKLPQASNAVLEDTWDVSRFRGHELSGKTLGIVGFGRLGSKLSKIALALGMNVIVFDTDKKRVSSKISVSKSLDELLSQADIISLHVPLNDETTGLISKKELALFKKDSILVNTARGALVDSSALLDVLKRGQLAGAALDVLDNEHQISTQSHPLIDYARYNDNLIITPHIGGATYESVEKTDLFVFERYIKWAQLA